MKTILIAIIKIILIILLGYVSMSSLDTIIARAHERGVLIRRATLANKKRGKMAKEKVCQTKK